MPKSPGRFARLLTQAVRRAAVQSNSKIQIVQDELGYAIGRETGGAPIEYWRKGHVPSREAEVEKLARELKQRGGLLTQIEIEQFLTYADHPQAARLSAEIMPVSPAPTRPGSAPELPDAPSLAEHPSFLAGPPITHPHHFFGRERQIKRLFNLLKRRPLQNAAIIGPRRSGKTSLLHYLKQITVTPSTQLRPNQRADWLPTPQHYRWILVDFQDSRLGHPERLLHYLLTHLNLPIPTSCTMEHFLDVVGGSLHTPTIILLDEIGVALKRYPELDDSFWEGLRALATHQVDGNLGFVLAAHEPPDQLAHHSELGSPFFNIFGYTALMGPFPENEARALITASPLPFPPDDIDWIVAQSQGWPILLQILCRERLMTLEEGEIGSDWREEGLQQMLPFQRLLDQAL